MTKKEYEDKRKKNERIMKNLIERALDRYDAGELIDMLMDVADKKNQGYAKDEMMLQLSCEGVKIIKCSSLKQEMELDDFLEKLIPFYSDRQAQIII